jgi:ribonuclease R
MAFIEKSLSLRFCYESATELSTRIYRFMEFSIAALLSNFTDDKLVAPKVLEKKLDCRDDDDLQRLQIALDALEKIGILTKDRGRYKRVTEEGVVEGKLRCSSKGFCFAIQDIEGAEDIYIRESQLSNAWNGDRVLVRVTKEGSRRRSPEGEVRLIVERSNPSVLARVKQAEDGFRAVPLDDRLLFEVHLQQDSEAQNGANLGEAIDHLAHVKLLRYPLGQQPPLGTVAKILGTDTDAADIDIVCCKHYLSRSFAEAVEAAAAEIPTKLSKTDLKGRVDLRGLTTVTIKADSSQANTDSLDDALTLEQTDTGHWRLGVHIADVSHYVEPDSPIDREARKRGTSVYLGDLVIPMLPDAIAHSLCAFQAGEDRLAVSVLVTLDNEGMSSEYEIQPTVINVDHQLSYQQAQAILERSTASDQPSNLDIQSLEPVFSLLDQLSALSHALKSNATSEAHLN